MESAHSVGVAGDPRSHDWVLHGNGYPMSWASDVQWLRCRNRACEHKLAGCRPLALQLGQHTVRIVVSKWEPRRDTVADAEDRVDRAAAVDGDDIESGKRGELVADECCDLVACDGDLVLMHAFHSRSSPPSKPLEYVVRRGAGGREDREVSAIMGP